MSIMEILCTQYKNGKMRPAETIPAIAGGDR
jgi:hypothetical protein